MGGLATDITLRCFLILLVNIDTVPADCCSVSQTVTSRFKVNIQHSVETSLQWEGTAVDNGMGFKKQHVTRVERDIVGST